MSYKPQATSGKEKILNHKDTKNKKKILNRSLGETEIAQHGI